MISLDLSKGPFGYGYPVWKIPLYTSFARHQERIHLIRGSLHDSQILSTVLRIVAGKKLDFLFIDGDHSYVGVRKDFEMYSSLVRKGGVIALHDIVHHPPATRVDVDKFWNEIKNTTTIMLKS